MHAWLCEQPTGVDALRWTEIATPEPAAGQVRIAIRAASLNFPDLLIVQNKYQFKPPLPFVPGSEFAGVVDAVGSGVTHLKAGDKVAALAGTGGFGTHACVDAARVLALPQAFSFEDGAAFAFTYGTSHHALLDRAALQPGETVLVLGAAGGVGTAAVQIAKAAGARVIAGASTAAKCELCLRLGADAAINYSHDNLRDALKNLTHGNGPDVVYDPVGGDLAEPCLRSIAWRGRYLVVGFAQGGIPALPWNLPLAQGRLDRRRVLGRIRAPRTQGQRRVAAGAGGVVSRRPRQTGHRSGAADGAIARCLRPHERARGAGQAGDGQLVTVGRPRPARGRADRLRVAPSALRCTRSEEDYGRQGPDP